MSPVLELNADRRQDLIETYAETMIEGMDYKTMEQLVYDLLTDGMAQLSDYELCDEVHNYHGADDDEFRSFCESTLTDDCLLYTSPSPRDSGQSRMPSSA